MEEINGNMYSACKSCGESVFYEQDGVECLLSGRQVCPHCSVTKCNDFITISEDVCEEACEILEMLLVDFELPSLHKVLDHREKGRNFTLEISHVSMLNILGILSKIKEGTTSTYVNKPIQKEKELTVGEVTTSEEVTIPKKRLEELEAAEAELNALYAAGVDSWAGYEMAQEGME